VAAFEASGGGGRGACLFALVGVVYLNSENFM
jgi:hypothetical protein